MTEPERLTKRLASLLFAFVIACVLSACARRDTSEASSPATAAAIARASAGLADSPWPMYMHDPQHTGRSPYSGPQKPRIKWTLDAGAPITSSPTIGADGTLYVGSVKGKLFAVTPSGEVKWTVKTGNELDSSRLVTSDGTSSPAVGSDGTVYVGAMDGKLYAVTPAGGVKWTVQAAAALASSPAIAPDGTVYVGSGGMGSPQAFERMAWALYAVTPAGEIKWKTTVGPWSGSCSPAIGADGTVYIGSGGVDAVTPAGQVKWTGGVGAPVFSSPAVGPQGTVFITSVRTVAAYTPSGKVTGSAWRPASWRLDDAGEGWSSPVIGADGTVYVAHGLLFALTPAGKVKWTVPTASGPCHLAIDAGGTVYVACWEGQLYAVTPLGKVKWMVDTGHVICSSPAIGADGTLYVGARLCAIGEESGESDAGSK